MQQPLESWCRRCSSLLILVMERLLAARFPSASCPRLSIDFFVLLFDALASFVLTNICLQNYGTYQLKLLSTSCSPVFRSLAILILVTSSHPVQRLSLLGRSRWLGMAYIQKLSHEILKDILDCIESNSRTAIPVDRRNHLSVESFRPPSPPPPSQAQDVANFRLSCRRFSELAIPYQYAKISLRFSNAGFQRLEKICDHHHLTRHTRKFSYLVPPFYAEGRYSTLVSRSKLTVGEIRFLLGMATTSTTNMPRPFSRKDLRSRRRF